MAITRQFDPIFNKYRGNLPLNFLRALGKRESNLNPLDTRGPAHGLMQITEVVRKSHNKRRGTNYSRSDLLNPDVSVRLATDTLQRIVSGYKRFHPSTPNMQENWQNREFVNLVVAGWNSGYSEAAGVGRVAKYLEAKSVPVTHDNVFRYASEAGATRHLSNDAKRRWQKTVTDLFYIEGGPGVPWLGFALAGAAAFALYKLMN